MSITPFELKDQILRAGAGAGKTTTLVSELVQFYKNFVGHYQYEPKVVVTTFTRKATHELKERLLHEAYKSQDHKLFQFLSKPSQLHISTIHGVLALFLKKHSAEIGLSPDFVFINEAEDLKIRKKLLKNLMMEFNSEDDFFENYQQSDILFFLQQFAEKSIFFDPLKAYTEVDFEAMCKKELQHRCALLLDATNDILEQTSLPNWQEYLSSLRRLKTLDWNGYPVEEVITIIESLGRRPSFKKAQPPFAESSLETFLEQLDWMKKNSDNPFFQASFWKKLSDANLTFERLARQFTKEYWDEKIKRGQLMMSDLEMMAWVILKKNPESGAHFSKDWDFWMVDEYQDTSPLQVELLKHLIGKSPQFIVGDPQQSIYLFRGAQSSVFEQKKVAIQNNQGVLRDQFTNYRSRKELLSFFNDFFAELDEPFAPMEAKKEFESDHMPATFILADEDLALPQAVQRVVDLMNLNVKPEDICVLSRNHAGLEKISKILKAKKIPYEIVGSSEFKNRREVQDAVHFIRFLVNPHDNKNFYSLLRTPWFHVSDQFLVQVAAQKSRSYWRQSLHTAVDEGTKEVLNLLESYLEIFYKVGLSLSLSQFYQNSGLIDSCFQVDPSGRRESNLWKLFFRIQQAELQGKTAVFRMIETLTDEEDLDQMDQDVVPLLEPQRVHLMTVHASKGLQFSHVILLGLGQDQQKTKSSPWGLDQQGRYSLSYRNPEDQSWIHPLSTIKETEKRNELERKESLRVLYVALTRAKESVTMILDQKPGRSSWQAQLKWDLSIGEHKRGDYTYQVLEGLEESALTASSTIQLSPLGQNLTESYVHNFSAQVKSNSATGLLDQGEMKSAPKPSGQDWLRSLKKVQKGTDYHKVFESLKYLSEQGIHELQRNFSDSKALNYVLSLQEPPLLELIRQGHVEWGFEMLESDQSLFRGQIDLWGIIGSTVWIVDYKTGSQEFKDKAFLQLKIYADRLLKINKILPSHKVKLAAVYPLDQISFVENWDFVSPS